MSTPGYLCQTHFEAMEDLIAALTERIQKDIERINNQLSQEENDQLFQFLQGKKAEARLILDYIEKLQRPPSELYDREDLEIEE
jgi:hypothetical protein